MKIDKWKLTAILSITILLMGMLIMFIAYSNDKAYVRGLSDGQVEVIEDMNLNLWFPVIVYNQTTNITSIVPVQLVDLCGGGLG